MRTQRPQRPPSFIRRDLRQYGRLIAALNADIEKMCRTDPPKECRALIRFGRDFIRLGKARDTMQRRRDKLTRELERANRIGKIIK